MLESMLGAVDLGDRLERGRETGSDEDLAMLVQNGEVDQRRCNGRADPAAAPFESVRQVRNNDLER